MKFIALTILSITLCAACGEAEQPVEPVDGARTRGSVAATDTTVPVELGALANAAFWIDPGIPNAALILGAAGLSGLDVYTPDGQRAGNFVAVDAGLVTVIPGAGATRAAEPEPKSNARDSVAVVRPTLETEVAASYGDAADDPAIWVHPDDPSKSLVIGTDKQLGLYVFDLQGRTVQVVPDGRMNNVDLRYDFPLSGEKGGEKVAIVAASNRSDDSIAVYKVDVEESRLVEVADGPLPTGFTDPYGLCMYKSADSGEFYVFVNEGGDGTYRQWRLYDNGEGEVAAEQVREFEVGSQAEGCVADDELGHLYIDEEDRGLWKYAAEPDAGDDRTLIDNTDDGHLTADAEGVSLWAGDGGRGYIVVSNQGANNYAVYRREGDNAFVGLFHIVANAAEGIDGASETDGLAVTSAPLGERYPSGLLVVQDGRNIAPEERQNFKFVSWKDVASAMGLK